MTLKQIINELCKSKGISIRKLEDEIGIAHATITDWDKHRPSVDKVAAVADYFGVTVDYLLGRDPVEDEDINMMLADPTYRALFKKTAKMSKEDLEFVKRLIDSIKTE